MAKTTNRPNLIVLAIILAVIALGAYYVLHGRHAPGETPTPTAPPSKEVESASKVPIDRIDPANEGRRITIDGDLDIKTPAIDTQLGIRATAIMLLRFVEMLQWQEQCTATDCTYRQVWSPQLISSAKFRQPEGHKNPDGLPLTTARYSAAEVRLGAFRIEAAALGNARLSSALRVRPTPLPVMSAALPSNLAISFHDFNGALYAGDPAHRQIGDVRVSYRTIPATKVELTGVQRGDRLVLEKATVTASPAPAGAD